MNTQLPPYLIPLTIRGEIVLKTFDPENEPLWPELARIYDTHAISMPLLVSGPEYALESIYFLACRTHRIPAIVGNVYSLPITREIIRATQPDLLITQASIAKILLDDLEKTSTQISFRTILLISFENERLAPSSLTDKYPQISWIPLRHPLV